MASPKPVVTKRRNLFTATSLLLATYRSLSLIPATGQERLQDGGEFFDRTTQIGAKILQYSPCQVCVC
jgi:hypothetical protein